MICIMENPAFLLHNGTMPPEGLCPMPWRTLRYDKRDQCAIVEVADTSSGQDTFAGELADVCSDISSDDEVRVAILHFDGRTMQSSWPEPRGECSPVEEIARLRQPVIAAIQGDCVNLGLELAMAADLRVAEDGARFGLTQIAEGSIPHAGGTQRLPRLVGIGKALEMVLTGEPIGTAEAKRTGLIHRIAPSGQALEQALTLARDMSLRSPLSLSYVKEALRDGLDMTLEQGLRMEFDLYLLLFSTADRKEGLTAFLERRTPHFKGE
jgi:enoyl-CoA hydratase/carnithine racemase